MKGDKKVLEFLNAGLKGELTAINQYFLHAKMLQDWGFSKLGKHEYDESIDEMKHAEKLIARILFLEGIPNLQYLEKLLIGEDIKEIFEGDLKLEHDGIANYKAGMAHCEKVGDYVTRDLFLEILTDEEGHVDYIETQLGMIEKMGIQNYMLLQSEANEMD
ncbi:MAG: bacterioferritin [Nisaea sp.]|jgi:bacterioferritin|uniref:bacterioferritin n=1 Tax=Nisaea sp. TaxID=2024842 RepID=UPI001B277209|nr:bacterioferritin [Nisaea sp.]MBO6561408.1 bacterioferritin [Nisaea sp.]